MQNVGRPYTNVGRPYILFIFCYLPLYLSFIDNFLQ